MQAPPLTDYDSDQSLLLAINSLSDMAILRASCRIDLTLAARLGNLSTMAQWLGCYVKH